MKNLILEHYKEQIENTRDAANAVIASLELQAKEAFKTSMLFKKAELEALQNALDNSKQLTNVEHDEFPHRFVHTDFRKLIDVSNEFETKMLTDYLAEYMFMDAYISEGYVATSEGPCILINEYGDVKDQDSGEWIVRNHEYNDKIELFKKIEEHMNKTGYYPSVVRYGRYGVEGFVDIQVKGA